MFEAEKLSSVYSVRCMCDGDADMILELCLSNDQYYRYCGRQPSRELILDDLHVTPPGIPVSSKYYVGFFEEGGRLAAVMDLIDGYPDRDYAFIGFFMMKKAAQGKGTGSGIISEVCRYLKETGMKTVRLGIDKGNPQSTHFWKKNGFRENGAVSDTEDYTVLWAQRDL